MNADSPDTTDATTKKRFGAPGPKGIVHRVLLILAVAILAVSVLYAGSRPVEAKDNVSTPGSESPVVAGSSGPNSAAVTREEAERALKYWTPKRMASATPAPLPQGSPSPEGIFDQPLPPNSSSPPVTGAAPVPPSDHTDNELHQGAGPEAITPAADTPAAEWTGPSTRPPAATTGQVFFLIDPNTPNDPTDDFGSSCSASTVNSAAKNLVFTAGHCVLNTLEENDPWSDRRWVRNIIFVPAAIDIKLDTVEAPYGKWAAREVVVHDEWERSRDYGYDVAAVLLWPSDLTGGELLVDEVGANGIRCNEPAEQDAHVFGYPQNHQEGAVLFYCHEQSVWLGIFDPRRAFIACDFSYGASGGPWLMNFNGKWVTCTPSHRPSVAQALSSHVTSQEVMGLRGHCSMRASAVSTKKF
jgi:V8-like Glu-specific endopeptidase